jgi:hypothetical protein
MRKLRWWRPPLNRGTGKFRTEWGADSETVVCAGTLRPHVWIRDLLHCPRPAGTAEIERNARSSINVRRPRARIGRRCSSWGGPSYWCRAYRSISYSEFRRGLGMDAALGEQPSYSLNRTKITLLFIRSASFCGIHHHICREESAAAPDRNHSNHHGSTRARSPRIGRGRRGGASCRCERRGGGGTECRRCGRGQQWRAAAGQC